MGVFKKGKSIDYGVINSVVGRDAQVKGEINSKGAVRIDGEFEGKISAKGDIFVGEGSGVVGNLVGARIVVSGEVNGNIIASNGLEITRTGRVYGDIAGDKLVIDEGAIYKGKVNMEIVSKKSVEAEARGVDPSKLIKTARTV
jgi:cytoskeletal protein CcmA (bactofilin family)